jgi:hypothetical protein
MRVLMLDIDGLQPAYLGPYGCEWAPTPIWDHLAVTGVVFDQHFADCPDPAIKSSWRTGQHHLLNFADGPDLLADLRSAGIRTARVGPSASGDCWDIDISAKRGAADPLSLNSTRRAARQAFEQIGNAADAFLRIEIDALLPPWGPSEEAWAECFGDADDESLEPWTGALPDRIATDDDAKFERIQNTYAAAVATLDVGLSKLLADCAKRGWGNDALWILTAGRGFPLGEHGPVGFADADVHEELVHLPLLLRWPNAEHAGTRVAGLTQPADLAATIREALHLPNCGAMPRERIVTGIRRGERLRWGFRSASWYLMLDDRPDSARRLFVKPDDRWEVNDVASRNQELVEEMEREFRSYLAPGH